MNAEGAGGISTTEDWGHTQVRWQTASSRFSQWALLRHLGSQVCPDSSRVGIDEDANPDHCASLEMRKMDDNDLNLDCSQGLSHTKAGLILFY